MNTLSGQPKLEGEEYIKLKIDEEEIPETLEVKEDELDKLVEEVGLQIEADKDEVLASADKLIESAPTSVGLGTEKVEEIYKSGGFAERIKSIKERINALTENTKEKIRLTHLKLKGIENPERVLEIINYLEKNFVGKEHKSVWVKEKDKESKKLKYEKEGYEVYFFNNKPASNGEYHVSLNKDVPYKFNLSRAKELAELLKCQNDPLVVFDALRDIGYELDSYDIGGYLSKIKTFVDSPNILPFLEKLKRVKSTTGINTGRDLFSSISNESENLLELARIDAEKNILNDQTVKNLSDLTETLGFEITPANIETWVDVSSEPGLIDLLQMSKTENGKPIKYNKYDEARIVGNIKALKDSGLISDLSDLIRQGFEYNIMYSSLNNLITGYSVDSAIAILTPIIQEFKSDPDYKNFVLETCASLDLKPVLDSGGKFHDFYKYPESPKVLKILSKYGIITKNSFGNYWGTSGIFENKASLKIFTEPDFENFADAIAQTGHKFKLDDFLQNGNYESWMASAYNDVSFRTKMMSEESIALAKQLQIFDGSGWNYNKFKKLLNAPEPLKTIQNLEQNFGYSYNMQTDQNGYELSSLSDLADNNELLNSLLDVNTIKTSKLLQEKLNIKFSLEESNGLIEFARREYAEQLNDQEVIEFIKKSAARIDIQTVDALLNCPENIRDIVKILVTEFEYTATSYYNSELYDSHMLNLLSENKDIIESARKLKTVGINIHPIKDYKVIETVFKNNLFEILEQYKDSPKVQNFIITNTEKISNIPSEKIGIYIDIFQKIDDSPSQEIQRLKESLLSQLVESKHPVEDYQKIESIFIKNNIPTVGKVYGVFETLYNPKKLEQKINQTTSPVLQQASTRKRYYTIYQDMLKIHIESGNRSMKEYAEILQGGGKLIEQYENNGLESLNSREQEQLRYFVGKLETLQAKSALDTADDAFKSANVEDLSERINHVREGLKVPEGQTVLERVSDMYLRPAGLKSLDELLDKMKKAKNSADERSRQIVNSARSNSSDGGMTLEIKAGDFLKGVNVGYISNILQNGSVAKEFLGASFDSDVTPLDTDISLVKPEDVEGGFTNSINASLARGYGELLCVLKDRGQYQRTVAGEPAHAEANKLELFQTGVLGERHYGIRTGLPTTEIDFMIATENLVSNSKDLQKMYFEIAQNGYYLPITDVSGKVIFTPEMYDEYRKSFAGLEKFDAPPLDFHPTTESEHSHNRVSEITTAIPEDSERVDQATKIIRSEIEQTLGGLGIKLRPEFDTSILGAELLDTGSTGRHTNTPGDFDFDFSLKLDAKDFPRAVDLAQAIKNTMTFTEDVSHQEAGGYYQLRVKGVTSIGGKQLEKPLDIDIGFASKSDLSVYGSHDAIRDKLNYIKKHDGQEAYEQTIANVILTKQTLKGGHAYKKQEDGGFGGVGVENWILANGGNMEEAFKSFRDTAYENGQRLSYEEFKGKYKILDPGTNIKFNGHDNFISILKPTGYEAMLNTIENYLDQKEV